MTLVRKIRHSENPPTGFGHVMWARESPHSICVRIPFNVPLRLLVLLRDRVRRPFVDVGTWLEERDWETTKKARTALLQEMREAGLNTGDFK